MLIYIRGILYTDGVPPPPSSGKLPTIHPPKVQALVISNIYNIETRIGRVGQQTSGQNRDDTTRTPTKDSKKSYLVNVAWGRG